MGIKDAAYNPMKGLSFSDQNTINQTGIYPLKPSVSKNDWESLKEYIISKAPDSLPILDHSNSSSELTQFLAKPISLDSTKGSLITFLEYDNKGKDDLIALTSQRDETITILYQQEDLRFISEEVIGFSPIYGSRWFELIDYDRDDDILLSSFTYVFTPVPDQLSKYWN